MQDDLYRPNYYQSLMEFRAQTLARLEKYAAQRFFKTEDYLASAHLQPSRLLNEVRPSRRVRDR